MPRPRRESREGRRGFPAAFRPPAFASWASCPARGLRPSCDRPTAPAGGGADPSGVSVFRARETRPGPGALYTPGTAVPHGHVCIPCPPPAALQRPVPVTPVSRPVPGCLSHEASARVHWRSPLPAIPLACGSQTERDPSGFPPGFTPGRAGLGRACRGGDRPQALTWNNAVAISDLLRRIHSQRATSRRNALTRCPLGPGTGSFATPIFPAQRTPFTLTRPKPPLIGRWIEAKGSTRSRADELDSRTRETPKTYM